MKDPNLCSLCGGPIGPDFGPAEPLLFTPNLMAHKSCIADWELERED